MDEHFVILDLETSNALAYPLTRGEAEGVFVAMLREDPPRAQRLALITLDKDGFPTRTQSHVDFLATH